MRFSTRIKVGVSLLVLAAIVGAFMISGLVSRGYATHAASASQPDATTGTLTPFAVVDPTKLTMTNDSTTPGFTYPKGTRHLHQAGSSHGPHVSSSSQVSNTSQLLEGFNGVSSRDSAKTNFGAQFEPPDQGLCVGNGFVVEPVNSAFTIYRADGTVVAGPFNVNKLYDDGFKQFTSDPRCYFDKKTNTWFAIILFINSTGTAARTGSPPAPDTSPA